MKEMKYFLQKEKLLEGENRFKNNKTGNVYILTEVALNATKGQLGQTMAVYRQDGTTTPIYVREYGEFSEKFTLMD